MGFKGILFTFLFIFFISSHGLSAGSCLLNDALKDPELSQNAEFWTELGKISGNGHPSDAAVQSLIEKFKGTTADVSDTRSIKSEGFKNNHQLSIHHKAEKEIKTLPANLKSKVDEFLEIALKPDGIKDLRDNPGRWHYEKLRSNDHLHTVRLNGGYRILFELKGQDIQILRVNREQIHGL